MPFQQSNNFSANNGQVGEKKKTNFPVGRVYGSDAIMNMSIWNSDSATYTILSIKQAIGKDPSTGANAYEQKAPNELPRVFLNTEYLSAFIAGIDAKISDFTVSPKRGSVVRVSGVGSNQIKLTIENEKTGSRTITFDAIPVGTLNHNASWENMTKLLKIAFKKALLAKLDPEEFAMALGADTSSNEASGEELPI